MCECVVCHSVIFLAAGLAAAVVSLCMSAVQQLLYVFGGHEIESVESICVYGH